MLNEYDRIAGYNTEVLYISPEDLAHTREYLTKANVGQTPFPVLIDADRAVVRTYKLEKPTANQTEVHPSMLLVDQNGVLRFKYIGQDAYDRPPIEHLEEMLRVVTAQK